MILSYGCRSSVACPKRGRFSYNGPIVSGFMHTSLGGDIHGDSYTTGTLVSERDNRLVNVYAFATCSLRGRHISNILRNSRPSRVNIIELIVLKMTQGCRGQNFNRSLLYSFFRRMGVVRRTLPVGKICLSTSPTTVGFCTHLNFIRLSTAPGTFNTMPVFLTVRRVLTT